MRRTPKGLWIALLAVGYTAVVGWRAGRGGLFWAASVAAVMANIAIFRSTTPPNQGRDDISPIARTAARVALAAAAVAALGVAAGDSSGFRLLVALSLAVATVSTLVLVARVVSVPSLVVAEPDGEASPMAPLAAALVWSITLGLALASVVAPRRAAGLDPFLIPFLLVASSLVSMGLILLAAYRLYVARRFELGSAERASTMAWFVLIAAAVVIVLSVSRVVVSHRALPCALIVAVFTTCFAGVVQRPQRATKVLRVTVALVVLTGPVVSIAILLAFKWPTHAGAISSGVAAAAGILGVVSVSVSHKLTPERSRLLKTVEHALEQAKTPDAELGVHRVLERIRDDLGLDAEPRLYRFSSRDYAVVNRGNYLRHVEGTIPSEVVDLASSEPHRVLSSEALRSVQVKQPEFRQALTWLDREGAGALALIFDVDLCVGALLWPAGGRTSPYVLEEVMVLEQLAASLGAATGMAARLVRAERRESEVVTTIKKAEEDIASLRAQLAVQADRGAAVVTELASRLDVACYSGAMASAKERAQQLLSGGRQAALVSAEIGISLDPWIATIHHQSQFSEGPLIHVDCATALGDDVTAWVEGKSPLSRAGGGTLVLLNASIATEDVQRAVAVGLAANTGLLVVASESEALDLEEHLRRLIDDHHFVVPPLRERAEDLRALALHHLVAIGVTLRGRPFGLDLRGQQLVLEHLWLGNEDEMRVVLARAARETSLEAHALDNRALKLSLDVASSAGRHALAALGV